MKKGEINDLSVDYYPTEPVKEILSDTNTEDKASSPGINLSLEYKHSKNESFNNPFPSAAELERLNNINPHYVERVFNFVEKKASDVEKLNNKLVSCNFALNMAGLISGFIIAIIGLISGSYFIIKGNWIAGTVFGGVPLVSLASIFVKKNWNASEDNDSK